jgi:adenylate cyclase
VAVGGRSSQEVARRAGVDPGYVEHLVALGILRPLQDDTFSQGDVLTARWVHSLEEAGIPLDGMATAVRDGDLSFSYLDAAAFDRFAEVSDTTFRQLSEDTGIPMELLKAVREAVGFAEPRPEDPVREDELSVVRVMQLMLSNGIRQVVVEQWLRVCGDGMRRIAETESAWWRTDVEQPMLEGGMTTGQMLAAQADLGSRFNPSMEDVIVAIYRGQQEHAWSQSALEDVEDALERAGLLTRLRQPPAVCFLDLTGYTRLTEERGDEAAAELAETLAALVRRRSQEHGGRPVKWLGDGVMFYFQDPAEGVLAALDMVEGAANAALPPARVGIDAGAVIFQEGDYYGRTVNIAARIAEYARPGEVLVSQEVVDASDGSSVLFTGIGAVGLKGVSGTLVLHSAHREAVDERDHTRGDEGHPRLPGT